MLNQTPYSLRGSLALCGVAERDSNNDWGFKLLAYPRFVLSTYRPVFQRVVETAQATLAQARPQPAPSMRPPPRPAQRPARRPAGPKALRPVWRPSPQRPRSPQRLRR